MNQHGILPEKVTKPIQLLAAWLIGLFVTNASFLLAAQQITHPAWGSALLVIAAVANVPVFIFALFLLQTKFRPQMQEDSYYSRYLDQERKFNSAYKSLSKDEIDDEISETAEKIVRSIGAAAEGKQEPIEKILQDSQADLLLYKHGSTRTLSELFKASETWPFMVKKWGSNTSFLREVNGLVGDGLVTMQNEDPLTTKLTDLGKSVAERAEQKKILLLQKRPTFWKQGRKQLAAQEAAEGDDA